jgi:hypothetical protein
MTASRCTAHSSQRLSTTSIGHERSTRTTPSRRVAA